MNWNRKKKKGEAKPGVDQIITAQHWPSATFLCFCVCVFMWLYAESRHEGTSSYNIKGLFIILCTQMFVCTRMCAPHECHALTSQRKVSNLWKWSNRWSWATMWGGGSWTWVQEQPVPSTVEPYLQPYGAPLGGSKCEEHLEAVTVCYHSIAIAVYCAHDWALSIHFLI